MRELPDIPSLATASPEKLHKLWEGLGYYTRVRNMQKAAQVIMEQHHGQFPTTYEEVLALPGIGRYTAGAICSIAFNQPTPILDGNVIRVLTRVFGIAENPREKHTNALLWELAGQLVQIAKQTETAYSGTDRNGMLSEASAAFRTAKTFPHCSYFNQSLMELGALVCTPRQPQCINCPLQRHCIAFRDGRAEELPNLGKRVTATERHFIAFVVERNGKFLVQQRPEGVVNANLWEFPNYEVTNQKLTAASQFVPLSQKPFLTVKHSITRYRITMKVFHANFSGPLEPRQQWMTGTQLEKIAFPSAHRKIAAKVTTNTHE